MNMSRSILMFAPLFVLGCSPDTPLDVDTAELLLSTHGGGEVLGSALGSGHYQSQGGLRTFSFNAIQHSDGSASGNAQFNNRIRSAGGNGLQFSLDVVCMNFVSENRVAIVGAVTHVNPESFNPLLDPQPGDQVVFLAQDNGEGNQADPDQTTGWAPRELLDFLASIGLLPPFPDGPFAEVICGGEHNDYLNAFGLTEIEQGNIQVRAP